MRIAISQQTIKCSELICRLTPTSNERLSELVQYLTTALEIYPSDIVNLFKRSLHPNSAPVYDHVHDLAEWYDNNVQLPRLLIAICDHNNYVDSLPDEITEELGFDCTQVLLEAKENFNTYVKNQRKSIGLS